MEFFGNGHGFENDWVSVALLDADSGSLLNLQKGVQVRRASIMPPQVGSPPPDGDWVIGEGFGEEGKTLPSRLEVVIYQFHNMRSSPVDKGKLYEC